MFFQTTRGWSPITLAIQLLTVDPNKNETHSFTAFEFDTRDDGFGFGGRKQIFLMLLATNAALGEQTQLPPPVVPSRFTEQSEELAIRILRNFTDLCRKPLAFSAASQISKAANSFSAASSSGAGGVAGGGRGGGFVGGSVGFGSSSSSGRPVWEDQPAPKGSSGGSFGEGLLQAVSRGAVGSSSSDPEGEAGLPRRGSAGSPDDAYDPNLLSRVTHATFIAAAHANRTKLAKALLDDRLVDPNCRAVFPIELRPLHVVCASGYGQLAQLLLDYNADPSLADERGRKPIEKLFAYQQLIIREQNKQLRALQGGGRS